MGYVLHLLPSIVALVPRPRRFTYEPILGTVLLLLLGLPLFVAVAAWVWRVVRARRRHRKLRPSP
jgi:hypothetical protein